MTFGLRVYNEAGLLQFHNGFVTPEFIGKIITADNGLTAYSGGESGFTTRSYSGTAPSFGGRDVIIFWELPQGVQWLIPTRFAIAAASGTGIGLFAFVDPATTITGVPVGYVFALGVTPSAEQFGIRVWDDTGRLTFDSGRPHMALHQVPALDNLVPGVTKTVSLARTLPAKPAFLMPDVVRKIDEYEGSNTGNGIGRMREWWGSVSHSTGVVSVRFPQVQDEQVPASDIFSTFGYYQDRTYGNTGGLTLPIIDASIYD